MIFWKCSWIWFTRPDPPGMGSQSRASTSSRSTWPMTRIWRSSRCMSRIWAAPMRRDSSRLYACIRSAHDVCKKSHHFGFSAAAFLVAVQKMFDLALAGQGGDTLSADAAQRVSQLLLLINGRSCPHVHQAHVDTAAYAVLFPCRTRPRASETGFLPRLKSGIDGPGPRHKQKWPEDSGRSMTPRPDPHWFP